MADFNFNLSDTGGDIVITDATNQIILRLPRAETILTTTEDGVLLTTKGLSIPINFEQAQIGADTPSSAAQAHSFLNAIAPVTVETINPITRVVKITKTFADFNNQAVQNTPSYLYTYKPKECLLNAFVNVVEAFVGNVNMANIRMSVEQPNISGPFLEVALSSIGYFPGSPSIPFSPQHLTESVNCEVNVACDQVEGALLNTLTAGRFEVYLLIVELP